MVLGDIAYRHGLPEDYAAVTPTARSHGRAVSRVCLTLGNHDIRENFVWRRSASINASRMKRPLKAIVIVEHPPVRFLILDSNYRVDVVPGMLGFRQRAWLDKLLVPNPTRHADHPLLPPRARRQRQASLVDVDRLLRVITAS